MFSGKVLWFIIGLFTGSFIGFLTSSLLVAAGSGDREENRIKFESDRNIRTGSHRIK